jgi:hypothetical protein
VRTPEGEVERTFDDDVVQREVQEYSYSCPK